MVLTQAETAEAADLLEAAERDRRPIPNLRSCSFWSASVAWDDAYAVQDEVRRRRLERGIRTCGYKLAITSPRKMRELGIDAPLCGYLSEPDALDDGSVVAARDLISPRIEPEIAFVTKRDLRGSHLRVADVLAATDFVVAAFEIIDSRYEKGTFDPLCAVADNVSTARHVLGSVIRRPHDLDLSLVATAVSKNGELAASGASAAVFGHPAFSLAALAAVLARRALHIPAGSTVLTGGLVEAFSVSAGDFVQARFAGLGQVSVRFD